jgi:hypothetical protein
MAHGPRQPQTTSDCKLKAVNPPFRSVSTPRARKDLRVVGQVNPDACARTPRLRLDLSEWNARRLAKKLEEEPSRDAWQRLSALATNGGGTVAQLLEQALSEGK